MRKNEDFLRNGLGRVAVAAKPRKLRILLQILKNESGAKSGPRGVILRAVLGFFAAGRTN